ncbi:MAG: hypothetical protein ACPLZC_02205 [Candidatus Bathyarchaeales archaeon]
MKIKELWRLSHTVYKEVSFQSIFSLRTGAILPQKESDIEHLVRNAEANTLISKILTTIFIAAFGFSFFLSTTIITGSPETPKELVVAGGVTAFLAILLFLIAFMGLQVATSFVSSKIAEVLSALPLSKRDVSQVVFLSFIRIFDIPLIVALTIFPVIYAISNGSFLGGLVSFISVGITEIFALALTISLAGFFYSRILSLGGRSMWKALLRLIFLIIWILPSFGAYLVVNFAVQIAQTFASMAQAFSSLQFIALIYPFSFGFLASYATFLDKINYFVLGLSIISSVGYVTLAVYCLKFVARYIRQISVGFGGVITPKREMVKDTVIQPQAPWFGIIRKDLRMASRSPSYASLFLLPAIQTAILAISFSFGEVGLSATLGMLFGMSLVTLLLPPTLLSIEGLASIYTRSLPLKKRTLILAKAALTTTIYAISLIVLFAAAAFLKKNFAFILTFGAIHTFSVAAASMLELKILIDKFWSEAFALGNVYARLSTFILVLVPGLIMVLIPIVAALVAYLLADYLTVLAVLFAVAISEFAIMGLAVFRK